MFPADGRQTTVVLTTTAIFGVFVSYIFRTFRDNRPRLIDSDMESLLSFPLIPKYVTLNDPE